eukprot:m.136096 g.136096  ORF g.136096 m.136096 type:complete len:954 (+) comp14883_c8_seq2:2459-5320(+)
MDDWELHPFLAPVDTPAPHTWYVVSDWEAEQCATSEKGEAKASAAVGPAPRLGHSCCLVSPTNLLLFAGATLEAPLNDIHVFDLESFEWSKPECTGKAPALRYDHGAGFIPLLNKLVVFGGAQPERNLCDIHLLDTTTWTWSSPKVSGSAPSPRTAHTVGVIDAHLVVFGGGKQGMDPVDTSDVYFFDVVTCAWKRIKGTGSVPTPRHGHTMTVVGRRLFVFGGMAGSTFFGDLYIFDLDTHVWTCPDTGGRAPSARSGHAAALDAEHNRLIVFGGLGLVSGAPTALADVHVLALDTLVWTPLPIQGPGVAGRMDFALVTARLHCDATRGAASRVRRDAGGRGAKAGDGTGVGVTQGKEGERDAGKEIRDITDMFGRDGLVLGAQAGAVLGAAGDSGQSEQGDGEGESQKGEASGTLTSAPSESIAVAPAAAAAAPSHSEAHSSNPDQRPPVKHTRRGAPASSKRDHELHEMSEMIEAELLSQTYDCIICFSAVLRKDRTWSCVKCSRVYHLHCVRKWAAASAGVGTSGSTDNNEAWRCPGCQHVHNSIPSTYFCFCGKTKEPSWRPNGPPPHTCGELCGKSREAAVNACTHTCHIPCHAGPCPPCPVTVSKACACGATTQSIRCAARAIPLSCGGPCRKLLPCGLHHCQASCHPGRCDPCGITQTQHCYCGSSTRDTDCGAGHLDESTDTDPGYYSCGKRCGRALACGHHTCEELCHKGPCAPCRLLPSIATTCGCGKQRCYTRTACTDPIFLCGDVCNKQLHCRHKTRDHRCHQKCHTGPCPPCPLPVPVSCLCGANTKDFPAVQCHTSLPPWRCETLCDKPKSCRRHRCNVTCCPLRGSHHTMLSHAEAAAFRAAPIPASLTEKAQARPRQAAATAAAAAAAGVVMGEPASASMASSARFWLFSLSPVTSSSSSRAGRAKGSMKKYSGKKCCRSVSILLRSAPKLPRAMV